MYKKKLVHKSANNENYQKVRDHLGVIILVNMEVLHIAYVI